MQPGSMREKKSLVVFLGMNIEYITKMIKYQEVSTIWTAKSDEFSLAGFVIEPASTAVTITMLSLPKLSKICQEKVFSCVGNLPGI